MNQLSSSRFGRLLLPFVVAAATITLAGTVTAQTAGTAGGSASVARATAAGRYAYIFFHRDGGSLAGKLMGRDNKAQTEQMRAVFLSAVQKLGKKAEGVEVNVGDPSERMIVQQYDVSRSPMPLVLVVAPNGAITRGFPGKFTEQDLLGAIATPAQEKALKALQSRKLVLLCVQNDSTRGNDAAMKGVKGFKADPRFGQATEIVMVDPSDSAEARMLGDFKVDAKTKDAVTVLLAPPGSVLASFSGATDKDTLIAKVTSSVSGCGSGCGPNGCGPAK